MICRERERERERERDRDGQTKDREIQRYRETAYNEATKPYCEAGIINCGA